MVKLNVGTQYAKYLYFSVRINLVYALMTSYSSCV